MFVVIDFVKSFAMNKSEKRLEKQGATSCNTSSLQVEFKRELTTQGLVPMDFGIAGRNKSLGVLLLGVARGFLGLLGLLLERVHALELQEAEVGDPSSLNAAKKLEGES